MSWFVMLAFMERRINFLIPHPAVVHLFFTIDSFGNKKYYVSFIDDFSKFTWIYLLRHRSEVFHFFKEF
jgi:hypothetical protein